MPSTYSNNLRIQLIAAGEQGNTWGITTNTNLGTLIEDAISGLVNLESPDAVWITNVCTLSVRDGSYDAARNMYLVVPISVTLTNTGQIIAPEVPKVYVISNYSNGGYDVEIKTAASTVTCSVPNGTTKFVVCDGADFYDAVSATGQLILQDAITDPSQATTKYYVDSGLAGKINLSGNASVPMGGPLILTSAAPSEPYQAVPLTYVDSNCLFSTDTGEQSMLGPLILSESPGDLSEEFQAATKGYVDDNTWVIPNTVPPAKYTNSNVTVDAYGHITNIENGTGGGGGGGVASVSIKTANGFQGSSSGGSAVELTIQTNPAIVNNQILYGTSTGTITAATADNIKTTLGSTAVNNATNSTQLNGQNADYYVAVNGTYINPNFISSLSVSKLNATATSGYVLTTNGTAAGAYWAANGGGGGGVTRVDFNDSFNGLRIGVSPNTGSVGLTITSTVSGIVKGTGSGLEAATADDIVTRIGSTAVQNASAVPWSGVSSKPADYPGGCTGAAGSVVNGVNTVSNQTIGGEKTFSERVLLSNAGFKFANDGAQDTGITWGGDGVMNVMCNAGVIGQFTTSGFTGNITGNAAGVVGYSSPNLIRFDWNGSQALISINNNTGFGANWPINITGTAASAVSKTGDTMSGPLNIYADASYSSSLNVSSSGSGSTAITGTGVVYGINGTSTNGYGARCSSTWAYGVFATTGNSGTGAIFAQNQGSSAYVDLAIGSFCVQSNYNSSVPANTPPSDRRLKENDQNISNGLAIISSLRPVKFNWKSNTYRVLNGIAPSLDYGFIAQEVEEVLPEAIGEITAAPSRPGDDTHSSSLEAELGTYKGMDYVKLIPFLTAAVQELSAKVDSLTSELNALKGN